MTPESTPAYDRWQPDYPCRQELANVVRFLVEALEASGYEWDVHQEEPEPDLFSVSCRDHRGYLNFGLIGWSPVENQIIYTAYKPEVAAHDAAEGVPEDESKCWWRPDSAEMMRWHLIGTVREIVREDREKRWEELEKAA